MSLISPEDRAAWGAEFDAIHETWGRPVVIYKNPEHVEIVTNDNYIPAYRNAKQGGNSSFNSVPVSGSFLMRIKWQDSSSQEERFPVETPIPGQTCRIKMQYDAYQFLSGVQSFFVDGVSCEMIGLPRPHGLFLSNYYDVMARRRDIK